MGKSETEILYVAGSSRDQKGKRVIVCAGTVQNVIWPEDGVSDIDITLLGLSDTDKRHIERFFADGR